MNLTLVAAIVLLLLWGVLVFGAHNGSGPVQVLYAARWCCAPADYRGRTHVPVVEPWREKTAAAPPQGSTAASCRCRLLLGTLAAAEHDSDGDGDELRRAAALLNAHVPDLSEEARRTRTKGRTAPKSQVNFVSEVSMVPPGPVALIFTL